MANGKKRKKKKRKFRSDVPLGMKLQYVGIGAILGVVAAPAVRRWIERARPEVGKLLEHLTAQAEELAEGAGDWMAVARGRVASIGGRDESGHDH